MALVVRKEEGRIIRYVHLSTGNYNEKTARVYTDLGYFTANEDFANDVSDIFNVITGYSLGGRYRKVVTSPENMRNYLFELIARNNLPEKIKNGLSCQNEFP
jgi:polyphosphate kinase